MSESESEISSSESEQDEEEFNKYQNGKIYLIKSISDENGKVYVGATTQNLVIRFREHKSAYKGWLNGKGKYTTSFELFEKYGIDDCEIGLLEEYPCESSKELSICERKWTEKLDCVNENIPGRTKKEYKEQNRDEINKKNREYYDKNKDDINKKHREHHDKNKEIINQKRREYRNENKEIINRRELKRYHQKKQEINQRRREKYHQKIQGKEEINKIKGELLDLIDNMTILLLEIKKSLIEIEK